MDARTAGVRKLVYTLELEVWGADEEQFSIAADQLNKVGGFLRRLPAEALAALPTGAITGEQHTGRGPGWKCVVKITEARE